MPSAAGRTPGAMGMPSMMTDPYEHAKRPPKSLVAIKEIYLQWLGTKAKRGSAWKSALKDFFMFGSNNEMTAQQFARAMNTLLPPDELGRLFDDWSSMSARGVVERAVVEEDLMRLEKGETGHIGAKNMGQRLDMNVAPGSKSRANLESADSSLSKAAEDDDGGLPYEPKSANERPITAALPKKPPSLSKAAGVAQVTGGAINNGSSVPGGIFSPEFTMAPNPPPNPDGGNRSNRSSQPGGIFEDHSTDVPKPSGGVSRSQRSSVPGGIFAPSFRPETVEYGYERFPRQGLNP